MPTPWTEKRRCRVSFQNFAPTATKWAPPSTLLWSGPLGRSWSWRHILAHVTGPSDCSSHCNHTHIILQMIEVYFWYIATEVNYWLLLLLLLFHIKLIYLLNMSLLIISVVLSFFVIMSINFSNRTHNWLGSSLHGKCLSVVYCVKWMLRKWLYMVEGAIIWSIASLPSSYRDEFLNLCCYCLGGGFFHLAYYVVAFYLKITDGRSWGAGNNVLQHVIRSVTTPISGCQPYQLVQSSKFVHMKEEPIQLFSCLHVLFSYTNIRHTN